LARSVNACVRNAFADSLAAARPVGELAHRGDGEDTRQAGPDDEQNH
jgi:hypothetical protein